MPENPNIEQDTDFDGFYGSNITMATTANNSQNRKQSAAPRVSSAGIKYYDIATQLLGKNGSDLEELFIAAAREGVYERIENFLQRNRSDYSFSIDVRDKKTGNTPLIWAAKRGHAKIVQLLLRHGADITLRNYEGHTAVEVASPSIRSILLESVERSTEASHQLLLQAAWQGDIKVVSRLLSQKRVLDINCQNADGFTPIMLATRDLHLFERYSNQMSRPYNPVEVVSELLTARADLHATDGDGKTCLHHASSSKAQIAQTVVSAIIAGGPNLEQKDKRCFAPLHCASLTGNADCISTLLDGGSEVNSRGFAGATALHITSYNNHEKATSVLLEHGANVALTDDRGLTPLDFAKTRKMRKRLQEAWTEVKSSRSKTSLGPIKSQSREDLRSSVEDLTKRKKGEVIFEGLPNNPFTDLSKKDTISNVKGVTRHQSLKEKSGKDEESTQSYYRDGVRKLGQVRNQQKPTPLPRTKSRSTERLPMISPDRTGSDRNLESPVMFGRNSRARRSFEDRHQGRGRKTLGPRESSNLGDDVFDRLTPGPPSPTPSVHHRRSESDPNRGTPNLLDIATVCDPYLQGHRKGRSYSVNTCTPTDLETNRYTPIHGEFIPLQREQTNAGMQREATLMSVCSFRTDSRLSTNSNPSKMLNLGQMLNKCKTPVQHLYGPGSNKVIPPSPAFITQRCGSNLDIKSDVDFSPRSDDGSEDRVPELSRSKTIYKDEFVIDESRPKDPLLRSTSGSDTVSLSGSSQLSSSPRENSLFLKGKNQGQGATNSTKNSKTNQSVTVGLGNNINALKTKTSQKYEVSETTSNQSSTKAAKTNTSKNENAKLKGSTVATSSSNSTSSQSMTLKSSPAVISSKNSVKPVQDKAGATKSGGTILVHNNIDNAPDNSVTTSEVNTKTYDCKPSDSNKDTKKQSDGKDSKMPADKKITGNSESKSSVQEGNSVARRKTEKQMQNVLKVVPTKLTENIVRTAPKSVKEETSTTKVLSSKNAGKAATNAKQNVNNVNMQLSTSAQVKNRVASNGASDIRNRDSNAVPVSKEDDASKHKAEEVFTANNTSVGQNVKESGKGPDQETKVLSSQSNTASAQSGQKQSGQSRNVNFNTSKSATVSSQRSMGNVRRTTASYTPRFSSAVSSKPNNSVPSADTSGKDDSAVKKTSTQTNIDTQNGTVKVADQKPDVTVQKPEIKVVKPASPTELVGPSVNKSTSISKSYNMVSTQPSSKSSNTATVASSSTFSSSKSTASGVEKPGQKKHAVLSKSVSDPLEKVGKVSNTSIVSKSVCQMPSVCTVASEKTTASKGLLRSSSMSIIEEKNEKQLMSFSDTKIQGHTKKQRPASDGPISGSEKEVDSKKAAKPLVEILPDGVPRVSKRNYVDSTNPHSTPVIVNPFEELEQKREKENMQKLEARALTATEFGFVVDKPGIERSKTQVSVKGKSTKTAKKGGSAKPSSAQSRVLSAKKKRARSKDPNKSDTENSRPKSGKSGKRVKSGKRKRKTPVNLANENEKSDVALIGGIGWQIATSCIDKSDADAVKVSQIDSSESESECVEIMDTNKPLHLDIPSDLNLHIPNAIETPSSAHSPRFKEILPSVDAHPKERLPQIENDGYRPMNLDLTQNSFGSQNRSGVLIGQEMPGDISDFLSQLREDEREVFTDEDAYYDDNYYEHEDENGNIGLVQRGGVYCHLTPIPESPSLSNTLNTSQRVSVTQAVEAALQRFDRNVKEEDLNKMLGATPRDDSGSSSRTKSNAARKGSGSVQTGLSQPGSAKSHSHTSRGGSGTVQGSGSQPTSAQSRAPQSRANSGSVISGSQPSSAQSKGQGQRNHSSVSRSTNFSAGTKEKINKSFSKSLPSPKYTANEVKDKSMNLKSGDVIRRSTSVEKLNKSKEEDESMHDVDAKFNSLKTKSNSETKERIDGKISDLKKILADKLTTTQKLLEESNLGKKNSQTNIEQKSNNNMNELKLNMRELTEANLKTLDSSRGDDEAKSTRSSRRERRFSETKKDTKDDDIDEAIDEILSNTFPSMKSTLKSSNSLRSANSTLTEVDKNVLKQMMQDKKTSPFHAHGSVKVSSSYDESVTLNRDNPDLMKRFHGDDFKMGQKVKAMVDAGAENTKIKAMIKADNEAKQIAKIMHSFKQMELYAGSNNKSSRKETPRREGEHMFTSMSRFDGAQGSLVGMPPRPGSAGAGRHNPAKFTEIKGKSATENRHRAQSPVNVPKDLAEEFKRSPFVRVSSQQDMEQLDDLVKAIQPGSPDSDDDHLILDGSDHERADSACTSLSSHSSFMEETIQWKKGNILGKGAFGTVWCGLTSEGQLIAVKQIELNTTNQHKAKKEYEKVQEEVELLKTLEHKNIVGYLGTSLEDSIVSIFMQFVPGGSIASILARFGALDEAVFRKYTRQIVEGVEYLHENDVIHRDIKGGNVMLMPNGVIKLIDFGCAKRLCINLSMGQSQILKSMKGTPYWMAPEVVNETGHGKKSDIWSVGCTVFEMATRKPPWADMNPMAAIFAIGSNKPVPQLPEKFSDEVREFVNACLTRDQTKRLSATQLLATQFLKRRSKKSSSNC